MRKILLLCILCAISVVISGCNSREGDAASVKQDLVSVSSGDTKLNGDGDESSSEIELPAREITDDDIEYSTPNVSANVSSEHTNNDNSQSEASIPQPPSENSDGTADSQVVSSEPTFSLNKNKTENVQEYRAMEKNANALEQYLRDNLSPNDYGGMYLSMRGLGDDGGIFLYVWTMDSSALDSVLAAYTGEPFPVERLEAGCSLAQLRQFNAALDDIEVGEDAYMGHVISEPGNLVSVTISVDDFERISHEIEQIAHNLQIPDECVLIRELLLENPVT